MTLYDPLLSGLTILAAAVLGGLMALALVGLRR